jgi:hypothetical protein
MDSFHRVSTGINCAAANKLGTSQNWSRGSCGIEIRDCLTRPYFSNVVLAWFSAENESLLRISSNSLSR